MLVSAGVLALLVVLMLQMMNGATISATNSRKHMDTDSQARMVFDRMENDFANMVKRKDVDYIFFKNKPSGSPGVNDAMFFYSEAPAYYDTTPNVSAVNRVALVGYRINSGNTYYPGTPILERLGKGLTWDSATSGSSPGSVMFLTYSGSTATPSAASGIPANWSTIGTSANNYTDGTDSDYHIFGDQVCRLEINFLLADGTVSTIPLINPSLSPPTAKITGTNSVNFFTATAPPTVNSDSANDDGNGNFAAGSRWFDSSVGGKGYVCINSGTGAAIWHPIGIQDVSAIIVAIAILDNNSRKMVSNMGQMAAALPDATGTTPIAETWLRAVTSGTFAAASGIPQSAASQVRIYQRYFYLNYQ